MRELLGQLAKTIGNSVSLQGLAQKTQLMSYHTAQDYLSILEQAFALRSFYAYDPEKDQFHFKKEKKFYFTDPIIYWVAFELAGMKIPDDYESQLAEMIAAEWLFRRFKRLGYYSTRKGEYVLINACGIKVLFSSWIKFFDFSLSLVNKAIVNKAIAATRRLRTT